MDVNHRGYELHRLGSSGRRTNSAGSSMRRCSSSVSRSLPFEPEDGIDSESVSEAGDIGDRALHSKRLSVSSNRGFSIDAYGLDCEANLPVQEQENLQSNGFWSHDPRTQTTTSAVTPLPQEVASPLQTRALVQPEDRKQGVRGKDEAKVLPPSLEYISCLIHLAVFGILGVFTRYLLQKLFGPSVAQVTSDDSILYLDLPSNMVGSFLMGWFGVVFKADISKFSDFLAIGLSTGYLGSVTTFSGWNQKMLDLSVEGLWVRSVLGLLLGLFLAAYSIIIGVETAKGFRWLVQRQNKENSDCSGGWKINSLRRHLTALLAMLLILGALLAVSAALLKEEFKTGSSKAHLWLGCLVAPLGVWLRWFLARLNGRGLGKGQHLKWVPMGTLAANVSAACVMAALATLKKGVNSRTCNTVASGMQLGFLGCLSTVSTFIAEFNAMRESKYPWRAYAYALFTMCVSFGLGTLIYSVPVWLKGYD